MDLHGKPQDTIVHEEEPFNAEPPAPALAGAALTPIERFYVRGHGSVPVADGALHVHGLVKRELRLDLADLQAGDLEVVDIPATLQCAGNRRSGLLAVEDIPGEAPWGPGATGTATWRGVRLADVLQRAGVSDDAAHVAFVAADVSEEADPPQRYGGSIPLLKAMRPEVLLAWSMNDEPLPRVHGGPLRVVVPGFIGARSVKWVREVEVRAMPYDGFFQATSYRLLPPGVEAAPGVGVPLGEVALNADVLRPTDGSRVPAGTVDVQGYAFAGGERTVVRVDLSLDGCTTWRQVDVPDGLGRWTWQPWETSVDLAEGEHEIVVRAWDSAAASQPEHAASVWNPKGYVNNSWARTTVTAISG